MLLVLASSTSMAVACSSDAGADKSGGQGDSEPVTLVMAQPNHGTPEQLVAYAAEVGQRSGGTVTIEYRELWRNGELDYEAGTVADVQSGTIDMAWVGARVFDKVGVTSFQALVAPMLIDSHDLQAAVFEAGIPAEMLAALDDIGLAGIGVLPGPMRKILGIDHPFVTPEDFAGAVVGIQQSGVANRSMAALGATTSDRPTGAELDGVDGYEQQFASIAGNQYWTVADHVTANVNLWPRPLVMFMNVEAFDALSDDQQAALRDSAAAAIPGALEASRTEDREGAAEICRAGMTLDVATASDLAALHAAFEPVYAELAADPTTAGHLDAIAAIKDELGAPPDSAECSASDVMDTTAPTEADGATTFPEGRFESTITDEDWAESEIVDVAGTFTIVVDAGQLTVLQPESGDVGFEGEYTVYDDRIEITDGSDTITARWSFDGSQLTFSEVEPTDTPFEVVWESHPWTLVGDAPGDDSAARLDGSYEWTITNEDIAESEFSNPGLIASTFTVELESGEWSMSQSADPETAHGTYSVFEDQIDSSGYLDRR